MSNIPRSSEAFHYLYKTIDKRSGKYYLGRHSTHNLNDGYQGSGKFVKDCLKAGVQLETVILKTFDNSNDCVIAEEALLNEHFDDPLNMNFHMSNAGGVLGYKHTEEAKKKMSDNYRGGPTESGRKKLSERMKGNKINVGRKLSEDTKKKIGNQMKGKNNPYYKSAEKPLRGPDGRFIKRNKAAF